MAATVLRVCRVLLGRHDADDAWSERSWRRCGPIQTCRRPRTSRRWLVTIARRKAIDVLRARGRAPVPAGKLPEEQTGPWRPGRGLTTICGVAVRALSRQAAPRPSALPLRSQGLALTTEIAHDPRMLTAGKQRCVAQVLACRLASLDTCGKNYLPGRSSIMNELDDLFTTPADDDTLTRLQPQARACCRKRRPARRRVPYRRLSRRHAAAGRHAPWARARRFTTSRTHGQVLERLAGPDQPAGAALAGEAGPRWHGSWRSTFGWRPAQLRRPAGLVAVHGLPAAGAAALDVDRLRADAQLTGRCASSSGQPRAVRGGRQRPAPPTPLPVVAALPTGYLRSDGTQGG